MSKRGDREPFVQGMSLFDASAMPADTENDDIPTFSVGKFTEKLERAFRKIGLPPRVAITGELMGWRISPSGHANFSLRERDMSIACFAWGKDAKKFPELSEGQSVTAYGNVRLYPGRSQYQLVCDRLELGGDLGPLYAQFLELKKRFQNEGLFEESRKRPIPKYPLHVTLVSAENGKGAEDFLATMARDVPWLKISSIETRVQGFGSEIDIADALESAMRTRADLIVLARGGGSFEELFPFNLEPVVRAIVRSPIPVLTAIAHTGDQHLADYAADRAFGTPSLAAEFIVKSWFEGRQHLGYLNDRLWREIEDRVRSAVQRAADARERVHAASDRRLREYRERLVSAERRLDHCSPIAFLSQRRVRLTELSSQLDNWRALSTQNDRNTRFERLREASVVSWRRRLERAEFELERRSPEAPLERGYAIVMRGGKAVRNAAELAPGEEIAAKLHRGTLTARVERVEP
jgi:exodeoxyribonuclease VII large subunit